MLFECLGVNVCWKRWVFSLEWNWDAEISECRSIVSERSIGYFETRVDCETLKSNNRRWTSRGVNLQVEKVFEIAVYKLKAIKLPARKIEKERVAVVDLGMKEMWWWFEQWNGQECSGFDESHDWIESMILTQMSWSENVKDESNITPRLRAASV